MVPPAPGRLSMMTFTGQRLPSSSARVRAMMSTGPAAGRERHQEMHRLRRKRVLRAQHRGQRQECKDGERDASDATPDRSCHGSPPLVQTQYLVGALNAGPRRMCKQNRLAVLCDKWQRDGGACERRLSIARSAVCASPVPHNSSLSCDLTRTRRSAQAAVSVQTHCSRYVDSLAGRTCVMFAKWTEARTQELHRLCPLFADRTQEDGKQTGRGQAHIPASHALTGQLLRLQWLMARPQPP